jgi:5-methylcytosine-specific restriction endonuclease McrA
MAFKDDIDGEKKKLYNKMHYEKNRERLLNRQNELYKFRKSYPLMGPFLTPEISAKISKEKNVEYKKSWGIENKEHLTQKRKSQYASERETAIKKAVEWNQQNPEKRKKIIKTYEVNNPDKIQSGRHNRRVREKSAQGTWQKGDVVAMFTEQKGLCAIGGLPLPKRFEVDHIKPLVLGGYNGRPNLQLTCPYCNRRKGGKHPDDFAKLPFMPCKPVRERDYQATPMPG